MNPTNEKEKFSNNNIYQQTAECLKISHLTFLDLSGYQIDLTFDSTKFYTHPQDISFWILPKLSGDDKTKHKTRGLELPGGKINQEEKPLQAVLRETWEETGGIINYVQQIGEYIIREYQGKDRIKAIYYGIISKFTKLPEGFETDGFELLPLPVNTQQPGFSPT